MQCTTYVRNRNLSLFLSIKFRFQSYLSSEPGTSKGHKIPQGVIPLVGNRGVGVCSPIFDISHSEGTWAV